MGLKKTLVCRSSLLWDSFLKNGRKFLDEEMSIKSEGIHTFPLDIAIYFYLSLQTPKDLFLSLSSSPTTTFLHQSRLLRYTSPSHKWFSQQIGRETPHVSFSQTGTAPLILSDRHSTPHSYIHVFVLHLHRYLQKLAKEEASSSPSTPPPSHPEPYPSLSATDS